MAARQHSVVRRWGLAGAFLAVLVGCVVFGAPARAAGPLDKLDTSLNFLPDDAAFYSASLRNGEQIKAIGKSRAWAAIKALPAVQDALKQAGAASKSGEYAAQSKAIFENPEVKKALELLGDMFSREAFIYSDQGTVDLIDLLQCVSNTMNYGQMFAHMSGHGPVEPGALALSAVAQNIDLLKVPNVIIGFRVKDQQLAREELTKLEGMINVFLMFVPEVASRWKRSTVAGSEYLTLTLDAGLIPWHKIPLDEVREHELNKGDVDKVVARVKTLKKTIALGLRGEYLLLAVGPSTDKLAQLGKGKSLVTRPEFKPLEKFADRRLLSIGYGSQAMAAKLLDNTRQVKQILKAVDQILPKVDLPADKKAQIRKDMADLTKDLKRLSPAPGAMMSFAFLTDRGMEGYSYAWGDHPQVDSSKALSLLEHVGGKPILAAVGRGRGSLEQYETFVKWAKIAYGYFQEFGVPQIPPSDREKYEKAVELFTPLVKRLDAANRTLIEATADEQAGLVIDARLKSRQFCQHMPVMERPMPMIEPALVVGVSKPELVRKAMSEYRQIFNEGVEAVRKIAPEPTDIPHLSIPEPKATKVASGTLYTYEFPEEWGVTKDVTPSLGLSNTVGVVAATTNHAGRLLSPTPPSVDGVLANAHRPRAMAVALDWAGVVDAATPWVEYAVKQIAKEETPKARPSKGKRAKAKKAEAKVEAGGPEAKKEATPKPGSDKTAAVQPGAKAVHAKKPAGEKPEAKTAEGKKPAGKPAILPQVRTALKVLKVIPSITGETYQEDHALVTHTLVEVRDID